MNRLSIRLATTPDEKTVNSSNRLFTGQCNFLKGVVNLSGLPPDDRVEVCFAGRSNVGKSSLINALTNQRGLARTSKTPGRTREINFFALGSRHYLVDLPGYGYARMPKEVAANTQRLLRSYLRGRSTLRRVLVLLDSRHQPHRNDEEFMELLDMAAVSFQIVLTKADKVGGVARIDFEKLAGKTLNAHPAGLPEVIATSSHSGEGIETLRATISSIV